MMGSAKLSAVVGFAMSICAVALNGSVQEPPANVIERFHYRSIGPTRQGGRTVDFAVPRQQPYTFYAATASGGLWKTVNNGQSFEPIFDNENVIALGSVAVAPSDPNIVWAGTGEPNNSDTDPGVSYWGDGVYKSTDGGGSWTHMGLTESHYTGGIIIHPEDPDIVYVAALGHFFSENPGRGLYKTVDGGRSWTRSLAVMEDGRDIGAIDVVMDPNDADVLYAATWDKQRSPWYFTQGGMASRIYKTTDAGGTWTKLTNGLPNEKLGRIGLDIYAGNPDILYAAVLRGTISRGRYDNASSCTVYRTDDGGRSWRQVSSDANPPQGGSYYGQIRVDPNDEDHVYLLSTIVQESRDGGKTWNRAWAWGGDNHALWIDPDDSRHMLLGYDFGFSTTYDGGANWDHPDNLPLAYLYTVGVDMSYPYSVYGGTQDNGGWKGPSTKKGRIPIRLEDWEHVVGGDGFYHQVDPANNRYLYNESQWGEIQRVDMETGKRKWLPYTGEGEIRLNWNTPILISPHNSDVVYHGSNYLMRSDFRGEAWYKVSPDLTTNDPGKIGVPGGPMYCTITTIDESPVTEGVIWVGTDDGNVQVTTDGGGTWSRLNDRIAGNPGYYVSRVIASHHHPGTAYVTLFRPPPRRLSGVCLQDERLRDDLGIDRQQSAGGVGQRHRRRSDEPRPLVHWNGQGGICDDRRWRSLGKNEKQHARGSRTRSRHTSTRERSRSRNTRPRIFHHGYFAAAGTDAAGSCQRGASFSDRNESAMGRAEGSRAGRRELLRGKREARRSGELLPERSGER